jgi:hypothetical protein
LPDKLQHETEQTYRKAAELALADSASVEARTNGFGNCLNLGLLYLEEGRLDEAEKLFQRVAKIKQPDAYQWLGHLGQAIVFALRNDADRSSRSFHEFFDRRFMAGKPKAKGKGKAKGLAITPAVRQLMNNQQWRYWMSRARWYNKSNGKDVGRPWLRNLMPVGPDGPHVPAPPFPLGRGWAS